MKRIIQCKYSCNGCAVKMRTVSVVERGDESVVDWLENVCIPTLAADHARVSPTCVSTVMASVLVPVSEGAKIGGLPTVS